MVRIAALALLLLSHLAVTGRGLVAAETTVDFARQVQPLLAAKCFACHGPDQQEGGLRLDRGQDALASTDSGEPAIVPGKPAASALIARVSATDVDVRMPPGEGGTEPLTPAEIALLSRWIGEGAGFAQHWAYRPLVRPELPSVQNQAWVRQGLDAFVLARLEHESLSPADPADRTMLIKRLHYDLLGLPPTIAEVDAFVHERSPGATERLVDRLLASPHFGERWGRHWLDRARYADSDGYEKDNARPAAYHYRDWVLEAINNDLPYDQFTLEQLAGDLLPAATDAQRLATAFHRQTLTNTEGGTDREQWRVAAVMDRTETLGAVWLGLTVGCARCHNHKYDQLSQEEYYGLFAYFNNGDEVSRELHRGTKKVKLRVIAQRTKDPRTTHVLRRGDFLQPEQAVQPHTPKILPPVANAAAGPAGRLEMAKWLVDGVNPLPPRVAVNHIWQHLFGQGLVRTPNDFGIRGEPPTHGRLLDYLASELVQSGWSIKHLIRCIVLSSTYQQSSAHRSQPEAQDPENRTLHRQNRFRVEAEIIRDITLAASGLLDSRIGGPSVFPPIPASVTDLTYNSGFKWTTSSGANRYRRGMYTFFKRTAPHPNLTTFDCPSSNVTTIKRDRSNTPIGALVTLNNVVYVEAARAMARQWLSKEMPAAARLRSLWRRALARDPTDPELARLEQVLAQARDYYRDHPQEAQALAPKAASAAAAQDVASWTITARVVLNLDEFITRE